VNWLDSKGVSPEGRAVGYPVCDDVSFVLSYAYCGSLRCAAFLIKKSESGNG